MGDHAYGRRATKRTLHRVAGQARRSLTTRVFLSGRYGCDVVALRGLRQQLVVRPHVSVVDSDEALDAALRKPTGRSCTRDPVCTRHISGRASPRVKVGALWQHAQPLDPYGIRWTVRGPLVRC
jgi:hypothetical protein